MSIVLVYKTGPGFIVAPTIERAEAGGIVAYKIVLYAQDDAQVNISFGPVTDDEEAA